MAQRWYVVRSQPRCEYMAADELSRSGYEVFLPCAEAVQPRVGHGDLPLFPGYLFLKCDLNAQPPQFFAIAPHVIGWVCFDGIVPSIPDEVVLLLRERLRTVSKEGGFWKRYKVGEFVQVVSGQVQEFAQILEVPKSPRSKARLLMEFMGRIVPAQVPFENLRPVIAEQDEAFKKQRRTRGKGRWIQGIDQQFGAVLQ